METVQVGIALSAAAFVGILACLEVGYRMGRRRSGDMPHEGIGAMEAAVFGLLGLLLAFSFARGTGRLDMRRQLIIEEANAIGTAYLRVDLLAPEAQPEMRRLFREYLDARLQVNQILPDLAAAEQKIERAAAIQRRLWSQAVMATRSEATSAAGRLLLPAINEMIDVTTSRTAVLYVHLPMLILSLLVVVALLSGLLAGYAMARRRSRSWFHMLVYALVVAVTIYTVIDLDHPRSGFIRLDAADKALAKLQDSIR